MSTASLLTSTVYFPLHFSINSLTRVDVSKHYDFQLNVNLLQKSLSCCSLSFSFERNIIIGVSFERRTVRILNYRHAVRVLKACRSNVSHDFITKSEDWQTRNNHRPVRCETSDLTLILGSQFAHLPCEMSDLTLILASQFAHLPWYKLRSCLTLWHIGVSSSRSINYNGLEAATLLKKHMI